MSLLGYLTQRWGSGIKLQSWYSAAEDAHYPVVLLGSPANVYGDAVNFVSVAQSGAGSTQLVAADTGNKHKVLGCILMLDADGTLKFKDSTGDLTGAMPIGQRGGFVLPAGLFPYLQTGAVNRSLSIETTGGAAKGSVVVLTEP